MKKLNDKEIKTAIVAALVLSNYEVEFYSKYPKGIPELKIFDKNEEILPDEKNESRIVNELIDEMVSVLIDISKAVNVK